MILHGQRAEWVRSHLPDAIKRSPHVKQRVYLSRDKYELCQNLGYPIHSPPEWLKTPCPVVDLGEIGMGETVTFTPFRTHCETCSRSVSAIDALSKTVPVLLLHPEIWHKLDGNYFHAYVGQCAECLTIYFGTR